MNKEQQIEKDWLIQIEEIDELIREKFHGQVAYRMDISKYGGFNGYTPLCTYDISKALYNAGYRKTFTSELASDTQKAYKEGYIKGIEERESEIERLKADNEALKMWNEAYTEENEKLKAENHKLENDLVDFDEFARGISKTRIEITGEAIPTCKTLLEYIEKEKRNAVKEFAEKLKKQIANIMYWSVGYVGYDEAMDVIDELLKEYEK
jgi:predicted RNase H-like nuclease (RuvC/YqgF family)